VLIQVTCSSTMFHLYDDAVNDYHHSCFPANFSLRQPPQPPVLHLHLRDARSCRLNEHIRPRIPHRRTITILPTSTNFPLHITIHKPQINVSLIPPQSPPDHLPRHQTRPPPHPPPATIPHASYLDLIIFPSMRSNLLTYTTQSTPSTNHPSPVEFDINELLVDMVEGGLRCWGNANPAASGKGGMGCPWDMRSWEASREFCRKWWFLVGGVAGEVWRTSEWWWGMRGE
jgi:hypothetical protein